MFHDLVPDFLAVAAIFFTAGAVKGLLGMGLPTVAMGLLGLVMPVPAAAALLALPSLVTNLWQAVAGPALRASLRRLWPLLAGILVGVWAVPLLLPALPDALGRRLLGACLLVHGVLSLLGRAPPPLPARAEPLAGGLAGAATGAVTGLTGVFVLPAVPYLQALRLGKDGLAQALGLCFTVSTLALASVLAAQGHLDRDASLGSLLMVGPALLGMGLGQVLRGAMSEAAFRRCFAGGLVVLGAWLATVSSSSS